MSETVELRPAFTWTCPECGRDWYGDMVIEENKPSSERLPDENLDLFVPEFVFCSACDAEFPTSFLLFGGDDETN